MNFYDLLDTNDVRHIISIVSGVLTRVTAPDSADLKEIKMNTHVAHYTDENGFNMTVPFDEKSLDILQILDDAKLETLTFEKIDVDAVIDEFFSWMNKTTSCIWSVEDMDEKDADNWLRYQDIDYWKYVIVRDFIHDCNVE